MKNKIMGVEMNQNVFLRTVLFCLIFSVLMPSMTRAGTVVTGTTAPTSDIIASDSESATSYTRIFDVDVAHSAGYVRGSNFVTADNPSGDDWTMESLTIRKSSGQTFNGSILKLWILEGTVDMWVNGDGYTDGDLFDGTGMNALVEGETFTLNGTFAGGSYVTLVLDTPVQVAENTSYVWFATFDYDDEDNDHNSSVAYFQITEGGSSTTNEELRVYATENYTRGAYGITHYAQGMQPGVASSPSPEDEQSSVVPGQTMTWQSVGTSGATFEISLGTTTACNELIDNISTGSAMTYTPAAGLLAGGSTYYWRVDTWQDGVEYTGSTWSFSTAGKALTPKPEDGLVHVSPVRNLTWELDIVDASSEVYFGPVGDLQYVGHYVQPEVSLADCASAIGLEMLLPDTQYQWRVDTRDSEDNPLGTGDTWSFTTEEYTWSWPIVVEDFDTYETTAELLAQWSDGATNGSNAALSMVLNSVTYDVGIAAFDYDNSTAPYDSRTVRAFAEPQDWTDYGASQLSLKVLGVEGNDTEAMYLVVSDGAASATIDLTQIDTADSSDWQIFNMRLAELTAAGIDLTHITEMAIGCGDGENPGGAGTLYLNDITRYQHRCLPEFIPAGDLDGDCLVDLADVSEMAADWLMGDYAVTALSAGSDSLVAYYRFEGSGTTASDSSGHGYDATIDPQGVSDYRNTNGQQGSCLEISGGVSLSLPTEVFDAVDDSVTIAFWIEGNSGEYPERLNDIDFTAGAAPSEDNTWERVRWAISEADDIEGQWNHYAFVKDGTAGVMKMYHNGVLVSQNTEDDAVMDGSQAGETVVTLLMDSDSPVRLDGLQIYHTALSAEAIAYLATGFGGEVIQPVYPIFTNAEVVIDGTVNLTDFAQLAADWLALP